MRVLAFTLLLFPLSLLAQNKVGVHTTNPQHPFQVNVDSVYTDTILDQSIPGSIGILPGLPLVPGEEKAAQGVLVGQTGFLSGVQLFFTIPTEADEVLVEAFRGPGPEGILMTSATLLDVTIGAVILQFPQPWPQVTEGEFINIVLTPVTGTSLKWKSAGFDFDSTWLSFHYTGTWNPYSQDLALNTFVAFTDTVIHEVFSVRGDRKVMINDYALPRYDGAAGDILQTNGSGSTMWLPPSELTGVPGLADADDDTKVEVEAAPDEDVIRLTTAGQERMTIVQNGKVGINTANPASDLDIRGDDDEMDGGELQLATPGMTNFIRMFGGRLGDRNPFLAFSDQDTFRFVTTSPDWMTFTRRMTITPDGKWGIGTEKPLSKLDIRAFGDGAELLRFNTDRPWVVKQTGTGISTALTFQPTTNDKALQILSENGANMAARFFTNNTYSKVSLVPDAGEVGIGILEAAAKLHVRGNGTTGDPQLRLTETSSLDFARIKMENENAPGIFWDIAAMADSTASLSKINFYYGNPGFTGDKMTITGEGKVGIGTTSPSEKLHVMGDMQVSGLAGTGDRNVIVDSNGKLKPSTLGSGGGGWIETPDYVYNNTHNIGIGTPTPSSRLHIVQGGSGSAQSIVFPGTPPFYTDSKVMTLDAGNLNVTGTINSTLALQGISDGPVTMVLGGGTVGIGQTAAPFKEVTIRGSSLNSNNQYGTLSLISEITTGNLSEMLFDGRTIRTLDDDLRINYDSPYHIIISSNDPNSNQVGIGTAFPTSKLTVRGEESDGINGVLRLNKFSAPDVYMVMDNNELDVVGETFYINGNSTENVAIGTNDPATGYKLSVGGKIIAEEVRVQLQTVWPDYVFGKDYHLMPLAEVSKVIEHQGHLPGIPSANEVESQGLLLGDMQRMMMEKIEEMTLHLIDLDHRMRQLEAENKVLREMTNENK